MCERRKQHRGGRASGTTVMQQVLALAALALPATLAASGTFSFLTLNVAGLPTILNSNDVPGDKTTNTASIGQDFADYGFDLIHVQEDFNYHATLYANDKHTYRTATSGGVVFGSGLNTLSNYDWTDFTRITWDQCYLDEGDCLTPKGFTYMRWALASGVTIDVYNLHTDAGDETGDDEARSANIQQVADYIDTKSAGQAVIVAGDTNSRYTRDGDNIRLFGTQNGLTDVWVQLEKGGTPPAIGADALLCDNPSTTEACETVDKVFYRSGSSVTLTAKDFTYDGNAFLQANGSILSDHNPVLVHFGWATT